MCLNMMLGPCCILHAHVFCPSVPLTGGATSPAQVQPPTFLRLCVETHARQNLGLCKCGQRCHRYISLMTCAFCVSLVCGKVIPDAWVLKTSHVKVPQPPLVQVSETRGWNLRPKQSGQRRHTFVTKSQTEAPRPSVKRHACRTLKSHACRLDCCSWL